MKTIILLSIFYFLFSTLIAQAALVPCGTSTTQPCTWNDFYILAGRVINFMIYTIAIPLGLIFIVVGSFFIMTAGGSTERAKSGRGIVKSAIIGVVLVFAVWLILSLLLQALCGTTSITFEPWKAVNNCQNVSVPGVGM